jgi:hypothetical protein
MWWLIIIAQLLNDNNDSTRIMQEQAIIYIVVIPGPICKYARSVVQFNPKPVFQFKQGLFAKGIKTV